MCLVFLKVGTQNIRIRRVNMAENVARRHSAIADLTMTKGEEKEFVNGQEKLLAKGFVCTVILVGEYGSGGVGITEGSNLRCGGSGRNIWCCTRI